MPTTLQSFPITEEIRISHPKILQNFEAIALAIDALAEAISAKTLRTASVHTLAAAGTTSVSIGSTDHTCFVSLTATTGTAALSLPATGRGVLDRVMIVADFTSTPGATFEIRDGGGALINSFVNDGLTPRITANLYFDGTKWNLLTFV